MTDHLWGDPSAFHQVGEHPPGILVDGRQGKGLERFLYSLPGCRVDNTSTTQQKINRTGIIQVIELPNERNGATTLLSSMVVPPISLDGNAVVAGQPKVPPGADEFFPSAFEEGRKVNPCGLLLLLVCEMNIRHLSTLLS